MLTLIQAQERAIAHVNNGPEGRRRIRKAGARTRLQAYLVRIGVTDEAQRAAIVRDAIQMADLEHACHDD